MRKRNINALRYLYMEKNYDESLRSACRNGYEDNTFQLFLEVMEKKNPTFDSDNKTILEDRVKDPELQPDFEDVFEIAKVNLEHDSLRYILNLQSQYPDHVNLDEETIDLDGIDCPKNSVEALFRDIDIFTENLERTGVTDNGISFGEIVLVDILCPKQQPMIIFYTRKDMSENHSTLPIGDTADKADNAFVYRYNSEDSSFDLIEHRLGNDIASLSKKIFGIPYRQVDMKKGGSK